MLRLAGWVWMSFLGCSGGVPENMVVQGVHLLHQDVYEMHRA